MYSTILYIYIQITNPSVFYISLSPSVSTYIYTYSSTHIYIEREGGRDSMSTPPLYVDIGSLSVFHFRNICIQYIDIVSRTILHLYIKRGCPSISIVNMNKVVPIYSPPAHGESLCIHLHIDKRSRLFYNYAWIEVHHLLCIYVQIGIFDLLYISLCMHG